MAYLRSYFKGDTGWLILIFALSSFMAWPLFQEGYFDSHERFFAFLRVRGIDLAIQSGQFPPQILPDIIKSFPYGYLVFYPPLSYEAAWLVFKITGLTIFGSIKVVHFLSIFLSGITMFYFVKEVSKNSTVAVLASIFYISAPYRVIDLYLRNALGESFAFIFMPIFFHGIYRLMFGDKRSIWLLSIGLSGHILAHNITAFYLGLFMLAFVLVYRAAFYKESSRIKPLFQAGILGLLISAYYVFPFFEYIGSGNYGVSHLPKVTDLVAKHAVYPWQLFGSEFIYSASFLLGSEKQEMPFMIGHHLAIFCLVSLLLFPKLREHKLFTFSLVSGIVSAFMTTYWFPWSYMPDFMLFIQFPWRMLMFAIFFLSISSAYIFSLVNYRNSALVLLLTVAICLYVNPFLKDVLHINLSDENFVENGENVEVPLGMLDELWYGFAPKNISKFDFQPLLMRNKLANVIVGDSQISDFTMKGTNVSFGIEGGNQPSIIELPLFFYDGYQAIYETEDGVSEYLEIIESPTGFALIQAPGNGKVSVRFAGTLITRISTILSLLGISILSILVFRSFRKEKNFAT